jgi:hypothetical protein
VNSAVCSHADLVSQKSAQRVPGCPSLVGKRLSVKRELSIRERRASTLRAKSKVEAETAVPAEKAKAETAVPTEKPKAETAVPAKKPKSETAVPAEKAKVEAEIAVPAESASDDSIVPEVANLKEEADTAGEGCSGKY